MIKNRFHGIFSLVLAALSLIIGIYALYADSALAAILYIGAIIVLVPVILFSYCSKCACRKNSCGHVIPGKLAKILPERAEGSYTVLDYAGVLLSLAVLVVFPVFSLWGKNFFFILFSLFLVIALVDILVFVCKSCSNDNCPLCRQR